MDKARGAGDDRTAILVIRNPRVHHWTTTSITSRFLVDLLDAAGEPPDDLLAAAGVSRDALATPDVALPLAAFDELWRRGAARQPDIGIRMVERFPEGQMHVLAHLALRSATVADAIRDVCRYASVTSPADHLSFETQGGVARFHYACLPSAGRNPWMAEHYLSMATVFLNRALQRPLPLARVAFVGARQAPLDTYVHRFGIAPEFAAAHNALSFPCEVLDWPLQTHDAYLHAVLERVAQLRRAPVADPVLDDTRRDIARALLTGASPTIETIAAGAGLGPRALRDRLARQKTTFRQVLDDSRRDLAREHLGRGLSVTETAYLLGFSEPAALQHACKRWFSLSAGDLRRQLVAERDPLAG